MLQGVMCISLELLFFFMGNLCFPTVIQPFVYSSMDSWMFIWHFGYNAVMSVYFSSTPFSFSHPQGSFVSTIAVHFNIFWYHVIHAHCVYHLAESESQYFSK